MNNYEALKGDVQAKRKTGLPVAKSDITSFQDGLKILEKNLKMFQESPMEYEMYVLFLRLKFFLAEILLCLKDHPVK